MHPSVSAFGRSVGRSVGAGRFAVVGAVGGDVVGDVVAGDVVSVTQLMTQFMKLSVVPLEIRTRIFLDPFVGRIPSIRELVSRR